MATLGGCWSFQCLQRANTAILFRPQRSLFRGVFAREKYIQIQVHGRFDRDIRAIRNRNTGMKKGGLGNSRLEVAPLAFGGNVFGWTTDERTSFRLLDTFVTAGFNLIDSADVYSRFAPGNHSGESETIIGKWLKQGERRDKVIIGTKVGLEMGSDKKGLRGPIS